MKILAIQWHSRGNPIHHTLLAIISKKFAQISKYPLDSYRGALLNI
jgi:hypothetical protein